MKLVMMIAALALTACASQKDQGRNPASDEVSGMEKGILCKAIEANYEKKMKAPSGVPKWIHCRENAKFMQNEDMYRILTPSKKGQLRCQARLETSGISHSPGVQDLECTEFEKK